MNFPYVTLYEIKTNLLDQNVMEIWRIQKKKTNKKHRETIDTNTYIMTFNTHKIPKEIKIGDQKNECSTLYSNPLRYFKCQRFWGTTRTNVENMTYITTAKKTTNVQIAKETMALVLEIVSYGKERKRDYQTKT